MKTPMTVKMFRIFALPLRFRGLSSVGKLEACPTGASVANNRYPAPQQIFHEKL
jgi:hypothetical protein